jgi:hypothetical protein
MSKDGLICVSLFNSSGGEISWMIFTDKRISMPVFIKADEAESGIALIFYQFGKRVAEFERDSFYLKLVQFFGN